ncbi:exonuclease domain-containing protein [Nesterenkonia halotolerans]|uniref:DNA polymerase-3 subunit epsilon n=1 Tax=Nesterenkonia halotolerans TaxID=225325 RepID=A0ABR9J2X5_9MICC|nr:exonuclease domain-containing protein [Nesterenkonia halotolerans]MBE1513343.1 DNA polymerase-3 subunit epsilon [Nesterenkonia halotolerans]
MKGLDFTAVDFETANGFRGSPCAIGMVKVRDGQEVDTYYSAMRPPEGFDRFDPHNVAIHGITAEAVAQAPRFGELFEGISAFIAGDVLVAHNAAFDIEVFESALEVSGLDSPGLSCLCSVRLSRANYQLPSHALPKAAAEAGYELTAHHYALEDARASAAVVCDIAERRAVGPIHRLFQESGVSARSMEAWRAPRARESRATRQVRTMAHLFDARLPAPAPRHMPDLMRWQDEGKNLPPSAVADPSHELFGQQLSFTGSLSIPRAEAKEVVAGLGAGTSSRVTAATSLLVVGDGFEPWELAAPQESFPLRSSKARDALRRQAEGQSIRLIAEEEFRALLGVAWPAPSQVSQVSQARESAPAGASVSGRDGGSAEVTVPE